MIKQFEGLRLRAYQCAAGVWTIGYGHTSGVKPGMSITAAEAENLLRGDLQKFENAVGTLGLQLTQNQFDALVSFAFNVGIAALRGSTLLRLIRSGASETAIRTAFGMWVKAGGKTLPGLVRRRKAEADLYFSNH